MVGLKEQATVQSKRQQRSPWITGSALSLKLISITWDSRFGRGHVRATTSATHCPNHLGRKRTCAILYRVSKVLRLHDVYAVGCGPSTIYPCNCRGWVCTVHEEPGFAYPWRQIQSVELARRFFFGFRVPSVLMRRGLKSSGLMLKNQLLISEEADRPKILRRGACSLLRKCIAPGTAGNELYPVE